MASTQAIVVTLTVHFCSKCDVLYGLTEEFVQARRKNHETFYCPNGHEWHYSGENTEERLKRELREERERKERECSRANRNHARAERERASLVATKGHVTRLKRKIAAGECPCCGESFPDLAAHMDSTHPDYAD
jgi:hypothetical protein